jgi:hypothetical protein
MRLSREHQRGMQRRVRRLGSVVPRCTEIVGGYAGGLAVLAIEPVPLWDVVTGAAGGFVIVLGVLLLILRGGSRESEPGLHERSRTLLDHRPGWRRVDDVALGGCDADHVIATPVGLLVVVTKWRDGRRDLQARRRRHDRDLAQAATAARGVRHLTTLPPNALDVPVHGAVLLWGPGNGPVTTGWDEARGVYVLDAYQPLNWPQELCAPGGQPAYDSECRPADVDEALRKVRGRARYHQRRLSAHALTRILLGEVRQGWSERRHTVRG